MPDAVTLKRRLQIAWANDRSFRRLVWGWAVFVGAGGITSYTALIISMTPPLGDAAILFLLLLPLMALAWAVYLGASMLVLLASRRIRRQDATRS